MENELTPTSGVITALSKVPAGTGPSNASNTSLPLQKVAQNSLASHRNSHR